MSKDVRRHRRISYPGPVRISWTAGGEVRYAVGKCLDVSEGGLRIEVPVPIPQRTDIVLNADRIKVSGSARVCHLTRCGAKFLIGVELSAQLQQKILQPVRDSENVIV